MRKRDGGPAIDTCIIDEPFITIIYIVKLATLHGLGVDKTGWYYKLPLRGYPGTQEVVGEEVGPVDLTAAATAR